MTEPEWIDVQPTYPERGSVVMVKRSDGREQKMTFERNWDGGYWQSFPSGTRDSIAHSTVVAWRALKGNTK